MLTAYGVTHTGRRPTNEDAFLVDSDRGLFVVADGMGGHKAGEVASDLAVRTIAAAIVSASGGATGRLEEALRQANRDVLAAAGRDARCAGMGTTVVAALVERDRGAVIGVGDSRVYHWHDGGLAQLTQDDSWIAHVVAAGGDPGRDHPMRHVLTKVIGLRPDLEVHAAHVTFETGDVLLLCSDGLHGALGDARIGRTLAGTDGPRRKAETLVAEALEAGATDNVTAVVVEQTVEPL